MSAPADRYEAARRWLRFASEDLHSAGTLLEHEDAPRLVCWAAEKAVKAALTLCGVRFPKTHDIDELMGLLPAGGCLRPGAADTAWLSQWAPASRYPGDWPEGDSADAQRAIEEASKVLKAAELDLSAGGAGLA